MGRFYISFELHQVAECVENGGGQGDSQIFLWNSFLAALIVLHKSWRAAY